MERLSLFKVFMSPTASEELAPVLGSGLITQGKKVEEFEKELRLWFDYPYILTVNSATSGLTLALRLLFLGEKKNRLERGDTVLCSPLTCFATVCPILSHGLNIVWVDVDEETGNISLEDLERKMGENRNVKAMVFVHWGGNPLPLDKINDLREGYSRENKIYPHLVEDCAHSFGADLFMKLKLGAHCGEYESTCVFSLQAIKHLTTGDGGLIFLPNKEEYEKAKLLRWYGIDRQARTDGKDFRLERDIAEWGYKFHMNDMNASIGLSNLKHMKNNLSKVRANSNYYKEELEGVEGLGLMKEARGSSPAYWIFSIRIRDKQDFIKFADERGIMASQVHGRCDKHSCVEMFASDLPGLDSLEKELVCIPCGWWIERKDRERIVSAVKEFLSPETEKKNSSVRKVSDGDYFKGFLRLFYQLNNSLVDLDFTEFKNKYKKINGQGCVIAVAEIKNKIMGTGKLLIEEKFYSSVGHIEDVIIDAGFRKKGLGREIVNYLAEEARKNGCYKVVLECNENVRGFYTKLGFFVKGSQMNKYI